MMEYYDLVLGLIPLVLVSGAGVLTSIGVAPIAAMSIASLVAGGLIVHGLFVRNPIETTREAKQGASRFAD
ncbi:putative membrane protein [Halorhabdus sp. SVX81]|uniref:hypothetical protein n=1 Tax=Halorhabdus sp. SVX81 TaxID=2978283 RepID=UPI0023DBE0E1|nr:hypothetical protein [Halorhabdus sp. SVX81]WEL18215.1 putative membrane protein [Halorhabdus sp. SVX81]